VLAAIDAGGPVHTSTGLLANLEPLANDGAAKFNARDIVFDHDAILLDEQGAATPDQGVGMLVNGQQVEVINSAIEDADRELDWAVDHMARALERRARVPMLERMKAALLEVFTASAREPSNETRKDEDMTISKEMFDGLSAQVNTLAASVETLTKGLPEMIGNATKPLTDHIAAIQNEAKAKADAEKAALVNVVVKANLLTEAVANGLTVDALKELAEKAKPGTAAALNAALGKSQGADEFDGYDFNALMEAK
jgi:hypothetical protein